MRTSELSAILGVGRRGRRLHLLDIENLVGGSHAGEEAVVAAYSSYDGIVGPGPADQLVIACGPTLAPRAWFAAPRRARLLLGRGLDGADRALRAAAPVRFVAEHYSGVVIGSGDGGFAAYARSLRAAGCAVEIVLGRGAPARALLAAADRVSSLSSPVPICLAPQYPLAEELTT